MMVDVIVGDLFQSKSQTLVNTVNCVGVMGKGLALEFKNRFPDMFKDYVRRCDRGEVRLGYPYLYKSLVTPWILNFPTKDHWRSVAKVEDIRAGLEYLIHKYEEWGITSIAVPPLGTGQGQLDWGIVGPTLYHYLHEMKIPVELYAPIGSTNDEIEFIYARSEAIVEGLRNEPLQSGYIKPAWVALVEILRRIKGQPYHWPIGRTRFQKMAYIASVKGLPLDLQFQRGSYGPYSPDLKPMLTRLINNGLIKERRTGSMFEVLIGPTHVTAYDSYRRTIDNWNQIIEQVVDLFMRIDTKEAEIIATVIYAATEIANEHDTMPSEYDVLKAVMNWKQKRRPALNEVEVAHSIRNLAAFRWLDVKASEEMPIENDTLATY